MTTGVCPGCGRTYTLRVTGMVRTHGRPHCPGSNQPPANDVSMSDVIADGLAPLEAIHASLDATTAKAGNGVASILDEDPALAPIGDVAQEMAREHNDLLRMADYRSLERWAAGMRDEIAARAEERDVRNARYDQWLHQRVGEAREWLAGVAS